MQSRRKVTKKTRKADDLDDLKQELDIDYHKITPEELYQRFQTHPENVSFILYVHRPTGTVVPFLELCILLEQTNYFELV